MRIQRNKTATRGLLALVAGLAVSMPPVSVAHAQARGDAVKGKQAFVRCSVCHTVDGKTSKLGPSLGNVLNRRAGTFAGFARYSAGMKSSKITWTPQNLDKFLAAPRTVVPGTTMVAPGVTVAADRTNIVAYLTSVSAPPPAKRR
jgi:cytochrome c